MENKTIQYIYLLQEREFIKTNENVYKIGKTKQANLSRVSDYPKGSILLYQRICDNCDLYELQILKLFRKVYKQRTDIGSEYFEGEYLDMINNITFILNDNTSTLKIDNLEGFVKDNETICLKFNAIKTYSQNINIEIKYKEIEKTNNALDDIVDDTKNSNIKLTNDMQENKKDKIKEKHQNKKYNRNMSKLFADGQKIRHKIHKGKMLDSDKIRIGRYDKEKNKIIYNDKEYSLNKFVMEHYSIERPDRTSAKAWAECECKLDGNWISIYNLPNKY